MRRLSRQQRLKRVRDANNQSWDDLKRQAKDPGLREKYNSLPRAPITLVSCRLNKAVNQGGILRLAECFRLEKVIYEMEADDVSDFSGVRGSDQWQPYAFEDPLEAVTKLKSEGYTIYGLHLTDEASPIHATEWKFPAAIVLGQELTGISDELQAACDHLVAIPLYGITISLNVSMAASIAVQYATTALHQQTDFQPVRQASANLLKNAKSS